ncbi:hypothetical protein QAD02_001394 [Eretmocerus hayati]|uniref:Uncharacterized protein n=1 Tax=Eretmocerus hayati TaxID=131215 RepID=A0ACC2NG01_9HYME|nr:hypothetical protein QAD02_001394 [Eretmocerus hayati]
MLSVLKTVSKNLCLAPKPLLDGIPNLIAQQTRNTWVLKRMYPVPLHKKGCPGRRLKPKHYIYRKVINMNDEPMKPLSLILTQYVSGVGDPGDRVLLKHDQAYNEFLLPGKAVYDTELNREKYVQEKKTKAYSSLYVEAMVKFLSQFCLLVRMNIENPWVLEKWHIKTCFRHAKVMVPEDAITMPSHEISGPNLDNEGKEFYVTVTINKREEVKVRCRLFHDTSDVLAKIEHQPNFHLAPGEPIFPEDKEILDSMPRPAWEKKQSRVAQ